MDERLERIDQHRAGKARRGKFSPLCTTFETFCSRIVCKESGWGKQMIERNAGCTRLARTNETQSSRAGKTTVTNRLKWNRGIDICSDRFCPGLFIFIPNPTNNQKKPSSPLSQRALPGLQLRAQDGPVWVRSSNWSSRWRSSSSPQ